MENAEIARVFYEIADLLEIKGENPFRIRSYRNAGMTIENLAEAVEGLSEERLEELPGIGKSIHEKINELLTTGRCQFHQELLKEFPPTLLDLLRVSGVGPKKVQLLYKELGIKTIDDLEKAARAGKLKDLPGMGEKTEEKILKSIEDFKRSRGRFRLSTALSYAEHMVDYLKQLKGVEEVAPSGSLRRRRETVGDIDILVTCKKGTPVMDWFVKYHEVKEVVAKGETKSTVILKGGIQTDVRVLEKKNYGAALCYFTGSKAHNIAIRDRAKKRGLKISEYGVFKEGTDQWVGGEREEDVFKTVGLPWIPPELRENRGEVEAAEKGRLPMLIELTDIKGDLQMHTRESDGRHTIEEMAEYAMNMGYSYIAITDHSRAVTVAHGLDEKRLLKQMKEIDELNKRFRAHGSRFTVLKGIEVDIKPNGTLDLDLDVLSQLDVVVGAVHSRFNMTKEEMTERIIKAFSTGLIHILSHPTGRLINEREPYPVDMERLMESARGYNVIMELNSFPDRLDLNDIHCKMAKDMGVMVSIDTDSHSKFHLENMRYGVYTARRGWLEKADVLNTRPLEEVLRILR